MMCRLLIAIPCFGATTFGCRAERPWPWDRTRGGDDSIQRVIEAKTADQSDKQDGRRRWEGVTTNEYQRQDELDRLAGRTKDQRDRRQIARNLIENGPVTLGACLILGLEFNSRIQAQREEIRAVGGEKLIVNSRYLPRLTYTLKHDLLEDRTLGRLGQSDNIFRFSQTLLEFGRDNDRDVALREQQREALFAYEDAVRDALSAIRRVFFTIRLRQRQLEKRQELLAEFQADYDTVEQREEARLVPNADLLTARLNVLNEKLRINSLNKEILRLKIELLHAIGLPVGRTELTLTGEPEHFDLSPERAVNLGLGRSTVIAQARAAAYEQARRARQIWWEDAPDLRVRSGWMDDRSAAGLDLSNNEGAYGLSTFAETHLDGPRENIDDDPAFPLADEPAWFVGLELDVPLFDGFEQRGKVVRERARLRRARHELRDSVDSVEGEIRQAYQTVLEARGQLEIQAETVTLSKARLETKQELQTLGRIQDNELELFRNQFFADQDAYFRQQIALIEAQEALRAAMRYFAPLPKAGGDREESTP